MQQLSAPDVAFVHWAAVAVRRSCCNLSNQTAGTFAASADVSTLVHVVSDGENQRSILEVAMAMWLAQYLQKYHRVDGMFAAKERTDSYWRL